MSCVGSAGKGRHCSTNKPHGGGATGCGEADTAADAELVYTFGRETRLLYHL